MLCYCRCKGEQKVSLHTPKKIHFRKIDGRDTRMSNFPAYIEVRENCEFRSSASRYFIKWILDDAAGLTGLQQHLTKYFFGDKILLTDHPDEIADFEDKIYIGVYE